MLSVDQIIEKFKIAQENHPEKMWVINCMGDKYQDKVILDLGCGKNKTVPNAIGIDIYEVGDIVCSIDELPQEDSSADIIISRHSLEHLLDPVKSLREWLRILVSGGKLIIVLPDHEFLDTMCYMISNDKHLHCYTRKSFINLLTLIGGFTIDKVETVVEDWSFGLVITKL